MIKRIIIRNGKKYIVNIPSWDDETPWLDGVWIESTGSSVLPTLVAGFTVDTASALAPFTASITNTTIYTGVGTLTYLFDFGDGSPTTTSLNVSHIYQSGSFIATSAVTESLYSITSSFSLPITSSGPYDNILVFSGSYLSIPNPTGYINQVHSTWKTIIGHGCINLTSLGCWSNQLTTLDLSGANNLIYLDCTSNKLTSLDVSTNNSLSSLNCDGNNLTTLNVSGATSLLSISISNNPLTTLDISTNILLNNLNCFKDKLTSGSVDNILSTLVINGQLSGTVDLTGTGNSAPSLIGSSSAVTLRNSAWNVYTN